MAKTTVRQVDIARELDISQAAVSMVLSGRSADRIGRDKRLAIEETAKRLGYLPNLAAQQLKGVRSRLLGVLIGAGAAPVLFDRVTALERAAAARGYRVLVGQIGDDLDLLGEYVDDFVGRGLDGVVCMSHELPEDPTIIPRMLSRVKHVVYLRRPATGNAPYVHIDAADCIHQAVDHLSRRGRHRIGMVILNNFNQANVHRREGYLAAMRRNGLAIDENFIWVGDDRLLPNPHEVSNENADRVVDELVVQRGADSIIAINDDWAAQLIKAIKRQSLRVPEDVAIVGQGDFRIASFFDPEITTLDPQHEVFANATIDLMVEMVEGRGQSDASVTVKPKLIVRQSA